MSYYLIDFTKKSNDFNFDNVIIGKKIKLDQDSSKFYIYYQTNISENPKEIYIRLPVLRLIYNLANHKYSQLSIPIYPNWDATTKFINFIKKLEKDIESCFAKKFMKHEWSSLINKKNMMNFIKSNFNDSVKLTSNIDKTNITLDDFKINGEIDMVIKLSYIWIKSSKMGLSSQIYQIKYLATPQDLDIDFIDDDIIPTNNITNIPPPPPLPTTIFAPPKVENILIKSLNMSGINVLPDMPTQIKLKIVPSIKDLEKAIKELKPLNNK